MKRTIILLSILLVALMGGCSRQPVLLPATSDEATTVGTQPLTTAPTQPETATAPATVPTEKITIPEEITTATLPTPTEPPTAPTEGVTLCGHDYQPGAYQAPTCEQAGFQSFLCTKCGDAHQQLSLPLGHSFTDATCTAAQSCIRCGITQGIPLDHWYHNGFCSHCGAKDPSIRTITIQIKDSKNTPVDGVTVALYIGESLSQYAGSQVSSGGQVSFTLQNHSGSYKLVLTQIPEGYKAQRDSYIYRSDSGSILLDLLSVVRPDDHSKAAYKTGSVMGDFTVTDVDGKTHQLSRLLQEKKLVILNFWYYTCVPCKAEFPYFNSIYQRYGDEIEILALNHFDSEAQIRLLRSEMGLTFPLASEHLGMQQGFGIQSYPVSVFIGSDGRIWHIQKDVGFETEEQLDTLVRQMLGKQ